MQYPEYRPRRLRRREGLRRLVRETSLSPDHFIYPIFVCPGRGVRRPIESMPGQVQVSVDEAVAEAQECLELGIPAVLLFGVPDDKRKDAVGSEAWNDGGLVQQAGRAIRKACPEMVVAMDACFDEYTTHGHCGVVMPEGGWGDVDNDATLENLARVAVSQAKAGADLIAPSGMMDGFVSVVREALDEAGYDHVAILAYSAKYASCFYGPFRQAAGTAPGFGHRRTYQLDPANGHEALREVSLDVSEGADIVMVKPALLYLDVVAAVRQHTDLPVAAYNVSGEYAMLKAAAERGWLDYDRAVLETLLSIRRAGADMIITYHAKEAARLLRAGQGEARS
ncbi:MAG: porphobilinogen synthase [Myxococcales bacterium]|nr:porphobilinogen synthase [Myxococcota bacterium]MDW8280303.1 porphobilinogen synthase [Myxococcales bacterium]